MKDGVFSQPKRDYGDMRKKKIILLEESKPTPRKRNLTIHL
jgi:hypothetical protein